MARAFLCGRKRLGFDSLSLSDGSAILIPTDAIKEGILGVYNSGSKSGLSMLSIEGSMPVGFFIIRSDNDKLLGLGYTYKYVRW
jgi:hypothetical protein